MTTTINVVNIHTTQLTIFWLLFLVMRTHKLYSLSRFQVSPTRLVTTVPVLLARALGLAL